jgi:tRNA(Ile)-lysidine synthase
MSALVERVAAQFDRLAPPNAAVLLAVSGGADSLAMLDLLVRGAALHGRPLVVGHVDHGIHPDSAAVADRVARVAEELGVAFLCRRLELGASASETTARRARRRALRAMAHDAGAEAIALAHHREDQAETVLLRVLGGSGPSGLAAMPARRGPWLRPMLECDRAELRAHLATTGLSPWQDPANEDPRHLRSWLRNVALPLLQQRFDRLTDALVGVAHQASRDRSAWNEVPALLEGLDLRHEPGAISVAAPPLQGYRSAVQDAVLSALGRRFGVPLGAKRRKAVRRMLAGGRSGAQVALGPALEAELTFDRLVLRRPVQVIAGVPLPATGLLKIGTWQARVAKVTASMEAERVGHRVELPAGEYLIRSWRPGDRIRPLGGKGSRTVAELFKEAQVSAGARKGWPVVVLAADDATLVWVPGICRSDGYVPVLGKEALDVECHLA